MIFLPLTELINNSIIDNQTIKRLKAFQNVSKQNSIISIYKLIIEFYHLTYRAIGRVVHNRY